MTLLLVALSLSSGGTIHAQTLTEATGIYYIGPEDILAAAIDLALGDPPNATHPVAWMGKVISFLERDGSNYRPAAGFLYGMGITLFTIAASTVSP